MATRLDITGLDDMLRLQNVFQIRSLYMVAGAMDEARTRANDYAAAGGRHRHRLGRYQRRPGAVHRTRRATGPQIASMAEKVLYRKFLDFFGDWE